MTLKYKFLNYTLLVFMLFSCRNRNEQSSLKHDLGDAIDKRFLASLYSEPSVARHVEYLSELPKEEFLSEGDPIVIWLNQWVSHIDKTLRKKYGADMAHIPMPIGVIARMTMPNAFVYGYPVLFKTKPFETINPQLSAPGPVISLTRSEVNKGKKAKVNCNSDQTVGKNPITRPMDPSLLEFMYSLEPGATCRISLQGKGDAAKVSFSKDCDNQCTYVNSGKGLVFHTLSNIGTFDLSLFSLMSEDELLFIVAHELAHYYKGHSIRDVFGLEEVYFYDESDLENFEHKPKILQDEESKKKGKRFQYLAKFSEDFAEQIIHGSALLPNFMLDGVKPEGATFTDQCVTDKCRKDCSALKDYHSDNLGPIAYWQNSSRYGSEEGPIKVRRKYDDFASKCLGGLPAALVVKRAYSVPGLSSDEVDKLISLGKNSKNLWQRYLVIVKGYTEFARKLVNEYVAISQSSFRQYTFEQEADELGLEIGAMVGVNPQAGSGAFLKFLALENKYRKQVLTDSPMLAEQLKPYLDSYPEIYGDTVEECKQLKDSGWRLNGKKISVNLGNLSDPHHSSCFRVWNIEREIRAHKYNVVKSRRAKTTIPWLRVQGLAKDALKVKSGS